MSALGNSVPASEIYTRRKTPGYANFRCVNQLLRIAVTPKALAQKAEASNTRSCERTMSEDTGRRPEQVDAHLVRAFRRGLSRAERDGPGVRMVVHLSRATFNLFVRAAPEPADAGRE